jgi:hypothetical protein
MGRTRKVLVDHRGATTRDLVTAFIGASVVAWLSFWVSWIGTSWIGLGYPYHPFHNKGDDTFWAVAVMIVAGWPVWGVQSLIIALAKNLPALIAIVVFGVIFNAIDRSIRRVTRSV